MQRIGWLVACTVAATLAGGGYFASVSAQEIGPVARPTPATETAAAPVEESSTAEEAAEQTAAEDLLDADALDELVAPIALYPDALIAQILVAATFPLDIVKADRFIEKNAGLSDKERSDQAAGEDWDPSIATLVGGFPTVVGRMADDIDWTENLGDAVMAQTDDVLDAVQRMRSRAVAAGTLASNEAQVVEAEGDSIAIAPADPNVVYVPTYDATTAYTAQPVTSTVPVQQVESTGPTTSGIITTGAIAFGSALLIDEIFDDDDDHDYWYGPGHINWDDDDIYPRRAAREIDGDVNIDRERNRNRVVVNTDGNRTRIGDNDRANINRDGAWRADPQRQADARAKIASRSGNNANAAATREKLQARDGAALAAGAGGAAAARSINRSAGGNDARAKLQAAGEKRTAQGKPSLKNSAFEPPSAGIAKAGAASTRGRESLGDARSHQGVKAKTALPKSTTKPKAVSRPSGASKSFKAPPRTAAHRSSAFSKPSSGSRAKAASSRGHASRGGGSRGGGGGGRRH